MSEKALARGIGGPTLTGLSAATLLRRRSYYETLEANSRSNDIVG